MRKLRPRAVKLLGQGHAVRKPCSWDLNPKQFGYTFNHDTRKKSLTVANTSQITPNTSMGKENITNRPKCSNDCSIPRRT